jgi:hypothetical protein
LIVVRIRTAPAVCLLSLHPLIQPPARKAATVYGILLEAVDTGTDPLSTEEFVGQVAGQGSFKAPELVLAAGADLAQCADALRKNGIYLEGAANFVPA